MRVKVIITPPPTGKHPPARLVPAPRGTNGTFRSRHTLTMATTSSVELGKTTTSGLFFSMVKPSHSYTSRSLGDDRTFPAPTMPRMRSVREVATAVVMGTVYEVNNTSYFALRSSYLVFSTRKQIQSMKSEERSTKSE